MSERKPREKPSLDSLISSAKALESSIAKGVKPAEVKKPTLSSQKGR